MKINIVDFGQQLESIKAEINETIHGVLESSNFIQGEPDRELEKNLAEWVGVRHVISSSKVTSCA